MSHKPAGSKTDPSPIDLGFGGLSTTIGAHIGHFYRNEQEMVDVMVPYFAAGLKANDKCTFFCRPEIGDRVSEGLEREGIDVKAVLNSGQLVLHEGMSSAEATGEVLSELIADAGTPQYRLVRNAGDMGWGLSSMPSTEELVKWEAMYDLQFAPRFPLIALCQYDLRIFGGEVVLDALKTHPLCIIGELIQKNPFYTAPDKFLDELAMRSGG